MEGFMGLCCSIVVSGNCGGFCDRKLNFDILLEIILEDI